MSDIFDVLNKLELFDQLYDELRLVDPVKRKVMHVIDEKICETEETCYEKWGKHKACRNCISMRASLEKKPSFKLEYKSGEIHMVSAVYTEINNQNFVVELVKNVTNSLFMAGASNNGSVHMISVIESMNHDAVRDVLTDVFNRRYMNEKLPVEILRASTEQESLAVIFCDIDHFKRVNDAFGHLIGDLVLKEFAAVLKQYIRRDWDWIARFGGEEFFICLPGISLNTARQLAEKIRRHVDHNMFLIGEDKVSITCSFGVVEACGSDGCKNIEQIIEAADKQMYEAKSRGRNQVY